MHATAQRGEDSPRLPASKHNRNPSVCTSSQVTRTPSPQEFDSDENDDLRRSAVITNLHAARSHLEEPRVPQPKPKRMSTLKKKAAGFRRRATIEINSMRGVTRRASGTTSEADSGAGPGPGGLCAADLEALKSMKKTSSPMDYAHQSSHPMTHTNLCQDDDDDGGEIPRRNSFCRHELTDSFHDGGGHAPSARDIAAILNANSRRPSTSDSDGVPAFRDSINSVGSAGLGPPGPSRRASFASVNEEEDYESFQENELDDKMTSEKLLEDLGDCPTEQEMTNLAAIRAKEYITELFGLALPSIDKNKWGKIREFTKDELLVGQHLGKGSFSDVFEVIATVAEEQVHTRESLGADKDVLDMLVKQKFSPGTLKEEEEEKEDELSKGSGGLDPASLAELRGLRRNSGKNDEDSDEDMIGDISKMMSKDKAEESDSDSDALDAQIDAMFNKGPSPKTGMSSSSFEPNGTSNYNYKPKSTNDDDDDDEEEGDDEFNPCPNNLRIPAHRRSTKTEMLSDNELPGSNVPRRRQMSISGGGGAMRRATLNVSNTSPLSSSLSRPKRSERRLTLAMKCLRPQIRSNAEQFLIGVEDLVHETAMLASLEHPHIVKLYGRAGTKQEGTSCDMTDMSNSVYESFKLSDGYFILLDRLKDTLDDRITRWKKTVGKANPTIAQIKTAMSVADALAYLHGLNIVFRDLKPANVGFDSMGVLKLFDFGFAVGIDEPHKNAEGSISSADSDDGLLYEKCGTLRYMAPEVGLELGYGLPCDVYSFGILLWEICSLTKPFAKVKSAAEFHRVVFEKGTRPKIAKSWPTALKDLIESCWADTVDDRPDMMHCKSILSAHVRELHRAPQAGPRKRGMLRRLTITG